MLLQIPKRVEEFLPAGTEVVNTGLHRTVEMLLVLVIVVADRY